MDAARVLSGLDEDQHRAVVSEATPLAVVAPAGSGKTRVLTRRVAHRVLTGHADPRHVLCVTFTRKAAGELDARLRGLGVRDRIWSSTFHAAAWSLLREHAEARRLPAPVLLDTPRPVLAEVAPDLDRRRTTGLGGEIAWAKSRLVNPDSYASAAAAAGRRPRIGTERTAELYRRYEAVKLRRGLLDFEDLLLACIDRLRSDQPFADSLRWRLRHLFVDEFQDVNPLQFALLDAWRAGRWDVFVVGDPHQSIYGWNGAEPRLLDTLRQHWPPVEIVELNSSHRSSPQIVAAAGAVIDAAGLPDRHPLATGIGGPPPTIVAHADALTELDDVATRLRHAHDAARPWRSFAVLARTHAQVSEAARVLDLHGIPTQPSGTDDRRLDPTTRRLLLVLARLDLPVMRALDAALTQEGADVDEPVVAAVVDAAERYADREPGATGRHFAGWARTGLNGDGPLPDAVTLATFHAAKGLEWSHVHLIGVEDGLVPIRSARRREQRDEEARLLYVAVTRAAETLTIHWCSRRLVGGRSRERGPSPYLAGVEAAVAAVDAPSPLDATRSRIDSLRSGLPQRPSGDPLLAALDRWRRERAVKASTAPEVVLADQTMEVIATRRPRSPLELEDIPGLGPSRARRLGPELLSIVDRSGS